MPKLMLKGNEAVAYALKLARVKVVPAYPITPSTQIPEKVSEFVSNGEMDAEFITVESEHSALSAAIGASATGVRTATATSAQGLALMHELLFIASGMRLPIVMGIGNRALSAPINIWCDHQDSIAERDSGWIQFYAESNQEALDLMLIAFKVAEDERVLLPALVGLDAFFLTHTMEAVDVPEQSEVDKFLGEFKPRYITLNPDRPATLGSFVFPDYYMEFKYSQWIAMERAKKVIDEVFEEFEKRFGRKYRKVETFGVENSDVVMISVGSMSSTVRYFVKKLRERGEKVGHIKLTVFRPFPKEELRDVLRDSNSILVLDRNISFGLGGVIYSELSASLYNTSSRPRIYDFIVGLGGRDVTINDLENIYRSYKNGNIEEINWVNIDKEAVLKAEGLL